MFQVIFEGVETVERTLLGITEGLSDLAVPTQQGLEALAASTIYRVMSGIHPDIRPESRAQRHTDPGAPALIDSRAMIHAATATVDGYDHSQYRLAPDGLTGQIGVDGDFHGAMRHQFGFGVDNLGRRFAEPARAFMVMEGADVTKVVEIYDRHLVALLETR